MSFLLGLFTNKGCSESVTSIPYAWRFQKQDSFSTESQETENLFKCEKWLNI